MKRTPITYLLTSLMLLLSVSLSAQREESKPSLWLGAGWGAGDGPHVLDDYTLLSLNAQLRFEHKLLIFRLENGWDFSNTDRRNYEVQSYEILCGYSKFFENHRLYVATGISFSDHDYTGKYLPKAEPDEPRVDYKTTQIWGVPVELGVNVGLSKRLDLGAAAFVNINEVDSYVGYLINIQFRLF
jgi:hypothetical protein